MAGEFTKRQTHGLRQYSVSGESMEGVLILLPDKSVWRRIKVRRVDPKQVPHAPARELYDGS